MSFTPMFRRALSTTRPLLKASSSSSMPKTKSTAKAAASEGTRIAQDLKNSLREDISDVDEVVDRNASAAAGAVKDTLSGMGVGKSHAKSSKLPKGVQEAMPEKMERAMPNSVHDTGRKRVSED